LLYVFLGVPDTPQVMSKWLLNVRHWEQTARFAMYSSKLLARYHRISLRELQRQFQYVYKVKVHQWLKHVRLTDAAKLLQPEVKIAEVAALVRYPQSNNFTRDFKRKFGITPEEYIKVNCPNPRNELFAHQYRLLMQYIDLHPNYSPQFPGAPEQQEEVRKGSRLKLKEELDAKTKAKTLLAVKERKEWLAAKMLKKKEARALRQEEIRARNAFMLALVAKTKRKLLNKVKAEQLSVVNKATIKKVVISRRVKKKA
jgi:AraC-like DNA-binding protein